MAAELVPGQRIGKCRVIRELGRGGMGAVWLGQHTTLEMPVAIKVLPPHIAKMMASAAERFLREARLAAKIRHNCVMQVLDGDQDTTTGLHYIVLEYVDGGSVRDLLMGGPIAPAVAVAITHRVAQALEAAAAEHIVHRDIKPDNIMLTTGGGVKLADLGLAKQLGRPDTSGDDVGNEPAFVELTGSGVSMGTPAYMSPEQIESSRDVDARSDIYSLGATLWHMLVGRMPYTADTPFRVMAQIVAGPPPDVKTLREDVSHELSALVAKMMERRADDRIASASELRRALEALPEYSSETVIPAAREADPLLLESVPMSPSGDATVPSGLQQQLLSEHPPTVAKDRVPPQDTEADSATIPAAGRVPPGAPITKTQTSVTSDTQPDAPTTAPVPVHDSTRAQVIVAITALVVVCTLVVVLILVREARREARENRAPQRQPGPTANRNDNRPANPPAPQPGDEPQPPAPRVQVFDSSNASLATTWLAHSRNEGQAVDAVGKIAMASANRAITIGNYDRYATLWTFADDAEPVGRRLDVQEVVSLGQLLVHSSGRWWMRGLSGHGRITNQTQFWQFEPDDDHPVEYEDLIFGVPLALTPDERLLLAQTEMGVTSVYRMDWSQEPPATERVARIGPNWAAEQPAAISPDGRLIATGMYHSTAAIFRVPTADQSDQEVIPLVEIGDPLRVRVLAFAPDSRWLLIAVDEQRAEIRELTAEGVFAADEPAFELETSVYRFAQFLDDDLLLTDAPDGRMILYRVDFAARRVVRLAWFQHPFGVQVAARSPDGTRLLVGGDGGQLTLWRLDRVLADLGR